MKRKITRVRGDRYCTVTIELEDGRLSIVGSEGRVLSRKEAAKEALHSWINFFEDSPGEIDAMNRRCGKRFRSARSAAKYVVDTDGEYHGIDVEWFEGDNAFLCVSCGQIKETVADFFPEVAPLLPWHLNDMKPGCEHQDALGWGHGHHVALGSELTPAQREKLESMHDAHVEKQFVRRWKELRSSESAAAQFLRRHRGTNPTMYDVGVLTGREQFMVSRELRTFEKWLKEDVRKDMPFTWEGAVYKDSIGAPCPECGYRYGTSWLKRELPPEIVALAETVCKEEEKAA
jgi:hypothetical protein